MIESRDGRRVVITGVGVVASCGVGAAAFWAGCARPPRPGDAAPGAGVRPGAVRAAAGGRPPPGPVRPVRRRGRRPRRWSTPALLAEPGAAGGPLTGVDPERTGVLVGSGIGGAMTWEEQATLLRDKGERAVSPLTVPMVMPNAAAAALSHALVAARPVRDDGDLLRHRHPRRSATPPAGSAAGRCDVAIAGGAEACLTDTTMAGFSQHAGAVRLRDLPAVRCRPGRVLRLGGRRRPGAGGGRPRRRPRRPGLRRGGRAWPRPPTATTSPPRRRAEPARWPACGRRWPTPASSPADGDPRQRARDVDPAQRRHRGGRDRRAVRPGPAGGHRDQGGDRALARRGRGHRGGRARPLVRPSASCHRPAARPPWTPASTSTSCSRPARGSRRPALSNSFGFGGLNGTLCLLPA